MLDKLDAIAAQALKDIESASDLQALEHLRVSVLGKKGALSEVLRGLGSMSPEDRPKAGAAANVWKGKIEEALSARRTVLEELALEEKIRSERIDTTLPARAPHRGSLNLITQTTRKIVAALSRIGFEVTVGPEVETEYLCFDAVNFPPEHPARDMQDTFFAGPGVILRTHTTPVQMRTMLSRPAPVRILCPGAVYRSDNDATHSPMFHQIEGLWIDRGVRMSDLRGTLDFFVKEIFGPEARVRLRPSYFPFVEPGAEVDVSCVFCRKGSSCGICKDTGWLEILGAGMVHPNLFKAAGYDPSGMSGFAFGMGIERIAMLLNKYPNMRLIYQNDVRFLRQF